MANQIYIGNFAKGLTKNRLPFNIDNDAFPVMYNMYSWRGRAKRKRGTTLLGQLQRQVELSATPNVYQFPQITLSGGAGNLLSPAISNITQAAQAVVTIPGSIFSIGDRITITGVVGMTQVNGNTYTVTATSPTTVTLNVDSTLFTAYASGGTISFATPASIVPGSISSPGGLVVGANTYTEPATPDGTLVGTPAGSGTINYATGAFTISGGGAGTVTGSYAYYPTLPVLGLEDFLRVKPANDTSGLFDYPVLLTFDQTKAYQVNQNNYPNEFYNVSYYKATNNLVRWSGEDYQLFWSTNYSAAFWATNNKPGFHFVNGAYSAGTGTAIITFTFTTGGTPYQTLRVGDQIWFNEWDTGGSNINGLVGTVSTIVNAAIGSYQVTFSSARVASGNGIGQLLTNSILGQDGIRWYDGDMTNSTGIPTNTTTGWVNFAPPLTATSTNINNLGSGKYYLVGALMIVTFKDRLLFFGPWIQTSSGAAIQLQDTVIWSWNGTPYYASLTPTGETSDTTAYYVDQTGKGGYLSAGVAQAIVTVNNNEDVLLVGFTGKQTRFVYTGNDLFPFLFYAINSELGASSTFSGISLDLGGLTYGTYGLALTTQQSSQRIDLEIPDEVFTIQALNNGALRVNAIRDFYREWVYFSFPVDGSIWKFPTNTLMYNYRDQTWAILYENYTAHGTFFRQSNKTWAQYNDLTWSEWQEIWSSGTTSALFPSVVAGNPQGYVLILDEDTDEDPSGTVFALASSSGNTQITSINNCVNLGDYLYFTNALEAPYLNGQIGKVVAINNTTTGTFVVDIAYPVTATITGATQANPCVLTANTNYVAGQKITITGVVGMTQLNGNTYTVTAVTDSTVTINVNSSAFTAYVSGGTATPYAYQGLGLFTRLSQPLLLSKQFNFYWEQGRQVRLGVQKYLLDRTANGQVTLNIYLSQNDDNVWNQGPIVPQNATNNSLIYSQTLFTCPENNNLQMPTASTQFQIWHRVNTSLIGDSVQIGITLNDEQMRNLEIATSEIDLHGIQLTVYPSSLLA